jgi:type II secretory pathway component HofQ
MSTRLLMALAMALALGAGPALAADPPAKKADAIEALLELLFEQEVKLDDNLSINEVPLDELLSKLSKRYAVTFVIQTEHFVAEMYPGDIREAKAVKLSATNLRGMKMHQFLTTVLESMGATYIVKGNTIEIVPPGYAAKLAKSEGDDPRQPPLPLVSLVVKEKPLNEAVALLAERYDLTVVVAPQAGDAKTGFVTARMLNVPAAQALDLLAVQSDLRVVRKGNTFLVTSRDHANELFAEKLEKERQKIELAKFRAAPPPRPQPEPKPGGFFLLKGANGLEIPLQIKPEPKPEPKPEK